MRPPDQDVRDAIVSRRRVTQAVEAGAGTGKTRLLVDRVLSRLEQGASVERLAVITFTKKAAAELVGRIRRRLAERSDERWAAAALDAFGRAEIGTTDSFCHGILARFPLEAGVPVGFGVADEVAQEALRDAAWHRFLEHHDPGATRALIRLRRAGARPAALRALAEELVAHRDLDPALTDAGEPGDLRAAFARHLDEAIALAPLCCDPDDRLLRRVRELERDLATARDLDPDAAERALLRRRRAGQRYAAGNAGRAAAWGGRDVKTRVAAALHDLQEAVDAWSERRGLRLAADAVRWAGGYAREYARLKRERVLLDFRDLALATRDLLRDRPGVRRRVAARYDEILMDEVQDTDPLQMEIAFLLAAEDTPPDDPLDARLAPGRLFLVGDPKQSIYRFRRADIELYERAVARIAAAGDTPHVRVNFRSRPGILRFVNRVFAGWMEPPEGAAWQARYDELLPAGPAPDGERCVHLALPDPDVRAELVRRSGGGDLHAEERRELEIDSVVRVLRRVVGAAGGAPWTVRDPEHGGERPAGPRDVAVLVRKIEWGDRLLDALRRAGIPATSTGGRRFWAREEIETLRALLEAIVAPEDGLARLAALRSLVFGIPDDELVLHFLEEKNGSPAAAEAEARLRRLAARARSLPVPELLDHVCEELCLLGVFGFRPDGAARIESLRMLLESADSLVDAGFDSLPEFVRWLRGQTAETRTEGLGEADPGDAGGVQILTTHKAKGLEFPIVVLADLAGEPRRDAHLVWDRGAGAIEFRLSARSGIATAGFAAANEIERERRRAEDVRLLYVAMTRARDALVVSWPEGSGGFLEGGELAARIGCEPGTAPSDPELGAIRAAELPALPSSGRQLRVDPDRPRVPAPAPSDPWPERCDAARRGPRVLRATGLVPHVGEAPVGAAPGGGGRAFGLLVHKALELWSPAHRADPEELVRAADAAVVRSLETPGDRPDEAGLREAAAYLSRVLRDPAVEAVAHAPGLQREVPFLLPVGDDFLSGTLDALVRGSGGALSIVDWKTDRIGDQDAGSAKERYRTQALAYAWAVHEITGRPVREVRLVFLSCDPVRTGSFVVGPELLLEARASIGAALLREPAAP